MRAELLAYLQGLSDPDYQRRVWVGGEMSNGVQHDEFDYAVHFLYDDTKLADDPQSMIGWILRDAEEAEAIALLIGLIEDVFEKHGVELSDAQYISLPEWNSIVGAAKTAHEMLAK